MSIKQLHYFRTSSAQEVRHGTKGVNVIFSKGNSSVVLRQGRVKVHSRRNFTPEARVQSQVVQCWIYVRQRGTVTGFSPRTSAFHFSSAVLRINPAIIREMDNGPIKDGADVVSLRRENK